MGVLTIFVAFIFLQCRARGKHNACNKKLRSFRGSRVCVKGSQGWSTSQTIFCVIPTDDHDRKWVSAFSSATKQRHGGVGLVMLKHVHRCLQSIEAVSERILFVTFHSNPQLSITVVYASVECSTSSDKEESYTALFGHLEHVKRHNIHLILGDINARIGLNSHVNCCEGLQQDPTEQNSTPHAKQPGRF